MMECERCGGPTMPETVIKLRRSFLGFRETRFQGAYCMTCKIGMPVMDQPQQSIRSPFVSAAALGAHHQRAGRLSFLEQLVASWSPAAMLSLRRGRRSRTPTWMQSQPQ